MKARLPKEYQPKSQAEILRQAQEMQANMEKAQAELEEKEYTATASGMITATVSGKHEIVSLQINPDLIEDAKEDPEMLEDLIITAVNQAVQAATQDSESTMSSMTSGLSIPGLF